MPPRSKQSSQEWWQCIKCEVIISGKDLSKHRDECKQDKRLSHGYISANVLMGVASPNLDEFNDKVPGRHKNDVVLLHPSVMRLCGLYIGCTCILNNTHVMTVWPCQGVGVTAVVMATDALLKTGTKKGEIISVQPLHDTGQKAEEVVISANEISPVIKEDALLKFLQKKLVGKFIQCGQDIAVDYFGQSFAFQIKTITKQSAVNESFILENQRSSAPFSNTDSTCDGLSDKIAALNLSASSNLDSSLTVFNQSDCSESKIKEGDVSTSTPVRSSINSSGDSVHSTPVSSSKNSSGHRTPKLNDSQSSFTRLEESVDRDYFCTPKVTKSCRKGVSELFYKVVATTTVVLDVAGLEAVSDLSEGKVKMMYSDIGGLDKQIGLLKEMVHLPLESPHLFKTYGLPQPRGILIFGPSGCGKSLLMQAVTSEAKVHVVNVTGPEIWSKFYGDTEKKLRDLFQAAVERSPSLVVIDEVEALCPRRDNSHSELEKRVVASMLTLMDGINTNSEKYVMVLATSSKPDLIDPAFRRPGRFDREIEIGVPSVYDRRDILSKLLSVVQHDLSREDMQAVADLAHGYVGADLAALCKEASLAAIQRYTRAGPGQSVYVTIEDLRYAMTVVQPSAMREVQLEVPKVLWTDIGGQAEVKLKLRQAVEWPLKHPEAFTRLGITPPKGILMYGPPGCSKTMIAKALATESGLNFIAVKGPELFSKWVGESERAVREVFRKARAAAPSIIFFDEMDALAIERGSSSGSSNVADRVLAQLLTEMDGVEMLKDVTIVAATNRPDMIDKALLRPGRIDRVLYVPLPDMETREEIFHIYLRKVPVTAEVTASYLAEKTPGYSGAEISSICHEAALLALQEDINSTEVSLQYFSQALNIVTPRLSESLINFYEEYQRKSGLHTV